MARTMKKPTTNANTVKLMAIIGSQISKKPPTRVHIAPSPCSNGLRYRKRILKRNHLSRLNRTHPQTIDSGFLKKSRDIATHVANTIANFVDIVLSLSKGAAGFRKNLP